MARRAISKKTRFEVFKRDSFTCQYCGRKAPDVVLHVDHVAPVAKGGANDTLNLITSCVECNAGKGARELSDDSVLAKQRAQLELLQERREQIQMMMDWQRSLVDLDAEAVDQAEKFWTDLANWYGLSDSGRAELRKHIRRHGLGEVLEAMRASVSYFKYDDDGVVTLESANYAFDKIGGICVVKHAQEENPDLKDVFYIRATIRNRFNYVDAVLARELLESAFSWGATRDDLYRLACSASSWTAWKRDMYDVIGNLRKEQEGQD